MGGRVSSSQALKAAGSRGMYEVRACNRWKREEPNQKYPM